MEYDIESIERRKYKINIVKMATIRILYILLIILVYNIFLISKSSLSNAEAKDVFGYKAYIITTDSMKPNIKYGDVVITARISEEKLKVGDIITFNKNGEIISHRIIEIKDNLEGREYTTKGDNNNIEDLKEITYQDILGTKMLVIPLLGRIILLLKDKIYIVLLIILITLIYLYIRRKEKKKKIRREKKKSEDKKFQNQKNNI